MAFIVFDDDEQKKLDEWKAQHTAKYTGAIGGRYEYSVFPTSLGVIVKVKDVVTGEELDLTNYEDW